MEVVEYEQEDGVRPFKQWFDSLDFYHALKVRTAVTRMEKGNFSNIKSVGSGKWSE